MSCANIWIGNYQEKVQHRLQTEATVPDFMEKLISAYNAGKMSYKQLEGNSQILIAAGSETTATLLAGRSTCFQSSQSSHSDVAFCEAL